METRINSTVPCNNLLNFTKRVDWNFQNSSDVEPPDLTFYVFYVFGILLPLSFFIITGNTLVVVVIHHTSYSLVQQRANNMFTASLAVADCLVGIFIVPVFYFGIFFESLKSNFYFCLVISSGIMVLCGVSMLHVLCIAMDRFLAVMFPLLYHTLMTPRRIAVVIIFTWSVVIGLGLTPYAGWRKEVRDLDFCYIDQVLPFSYVLFMFIISFAGPLFTMVVLYTRIIAAARRHVRRITAAVAAIPTFEGNSTNPGPHPRVAAVKAPKPFSLMDMKAIKTTFIVLGVFVLCWLPPYIFNFVMHHRNATRPLGSDLIRAPLVEAALNTLGFGNSAANPIIYALRYKEFRAGARKILHRLWLTICPKNCHGQSRSQRDDRVVAINLERITASPTTGTIQNYKSDQLLHDV